MQILTILRFLQPSRLLNIALIQTNFSMIYAVLSVRFLTPLRSGPRNSTWSELL